MISLESIARIARYGIVGIVTNLLGYLLFLAMLFGGMPAVLTSGVTYLIIVPASYYANRRWTFRSGSTHSKDIPRYLIAYGVGLAAAVGGMKVLSAILHPALAQLLVIVLAAAAIYISLVILRFGRSGPNNAH